MDGIGIWLRIALKRVAFGLVLLCVAYVGVLGWRHDVYSTAGFSRAISVLVWRPAPMAEHHAPAERASSSVLEAGRVVPTAAVGHEPSVRPALDATAPETPVFQPAKAPPLPQRLDRESTCLARAIYHEAAHDPHEVRVAIAHVAMVRLAQSAGKTTMCSVVYNGMNTPLGCLFLATCRNTGAAEPTGEAWRSAQQIAADLIGGRLNAIDAIRQPAMVEATHFHPVTEKPAWAASTVRLSQIGRFVFLGRRPTEAAAAVANKTAPPTEAVVAGPATEAPPEAAPPATRKKPLTRTVSTTPATSSAPSGPRALDGWMNSSQ